MKNPVSNFTVLIAFLVFGLTYSQNKENSKFEIPYGDNSKVGKFVEINKTKIYYEEYGKGEPLLLIHGCGADIKSMENQIDFFKDKFRIIVADSRGQGKSELKTDSLTYNQIAKDWEGLVKHLKLDSINIVGWSDGGIVGLKMGINNNVKIKKIVTMGANLRPDTTAVNSWAPKNVKENLDEAKKMIAKGDKSKDWNLEKQLDQLLYYQPNISHSELQNVNAAVLVINGDKDIIKNEHAVEIFENLPHAQLCIMPGETHYTPGSNPKYFNSIVDKFLTEPFERPTSKWD
ncbi:alpha/beta fold hydrolase [Salegentibacter chungangensis]|uniref:Alpha/beta fold hydrolase n=1 Tax=Salegentibacter chungangensis TaxID=1335724 RepID=A0ABW3NNS8_9FLAO